MIKILTISLGLHDVHIARRDGLRRESSPSASASSSRWPTRWRAGMWAVLWTDLVQFVIKMSAVIILAVYAVRAVGGMDKLKARRRRRTSAARPRRSRCCRCSWHRRRDRRLRVDAAPHARRLSLRAVVGRVVPGRGAGRRRLRGAAHLLARRRRRDGVLATLFFQVAHYAIRPWPWIVTGLGDRHALPERHRPDHDQRPLRAGVRRPAADAVARLHDGGLRRRVHVARWARSSTGARRTSSTTSTSAS